MAATEEDVQDAVPLERALEVLNVPDAWALLFRRRADVAEKKNDLQIMVGSRYHELIESADAIVSMRKTAADVAALLTAFPSQLNSVLDEVEGALHSAGASENEGIVARKEAAKVGTGKSGASAATRLLLNAPSAIWAALDDSRYLDAAALFRQCAAAVASSEGIMRGPEAPFLASQWTYIQQFPARILAGAKRALYRPAVFAAGSPSSDNGGGSSVGEAAAALAAVLLVEDVDGGVPAAPGPALFSDALQLLLRHRGRYVEAALLGKSRDSPSGAPTEQRRRRRRPRTDGGGGDGGAVAGGGAAGAVARARRLEVHLCAAVAAIQQTIVDVQAIFADNLGEEASAKGSSTGSGKSASLLAELVSSAWGRPNGPAAAPLTVPPLPAAAAAELCTRWLAVVVPKVFRRSKALLRGVADAAALAHTREALWTLTRRGSSGSGCGGSGADDDANRWRAACAYAVNGKLLAALLKCRGFAAGAAVADGPLAPPGGPLELWPLLFSQTFADLAQRLLQDSLADAADRVIRRLDIVLLAATTGAVVAWPPPPPLLRGCDCAKGASTAAAAAGAALTSTAAAVMAPGAAAAATAAAGAAPPPPRLAAHEVLATADSVASLLSAQLTRLSRDAWNLVQQGDSVAAAALSTSLYLRSVETLARLANHLRQTLEALSAAAAAALSGGGGGGGGGSSGTAWGLPAAAAAAASADEAAALVDAAMLVGRVCWLLLGPRGRALRHVLSPPTVLTRPSPDRIGLDQLEAAFEIADTDGDGVMDAEEAAEAVAAVSVAVVAAPFDADGGIGGVGGGWGCQSLTRPEFALFATPLLDEQRPHDFLRECLEHVIGAAVAAWADWALAEPMLALSTAEARVAAGCGGASNSRGDSSGGGGGGGGGNSGADGAAAAAALTDEEWRQRHGLWEEKAVELSAAAGDDTVEERMWFPAVVSPPVTCYLQRLTTELCRAMSMADYAVVADADAGTDANVDILGAARTRVAARAAAELAALYGRLCVGSAAPARRACEAMRLQCLLDCFFLSRWLPAGGGGGAAAGGAGDAFVAAAEALCDDIDPINLQIYLPHLRAAARASGDVGRIFLSALFPAAGGAPGGGAGGGSGGGSGGGGFSRPEELLSAGTNVVALAPRVHRFDLLPLPLPPAARSGGGGGSAGAAGAVVAGRDGLPGAGGLDAGGRVKAVGGQALARAAGLMGQAESMRQAVQPLSNIFGAASSFLGGGRRK